jgi:hypothetical protein
VQCRKAPTVGKHAAVLRSIDQGHGDFGSVNVFHFDVVEGECEGCTISKKTGIELKLGESLARFVSQLLGREIKRHERIDLESLVEQRYVVSVVPQGTGVGSPLEPGEPAFQIDPVRGELLSILLQAGLLPRVGRRGYLVGADRHGSANLAAVRRLIVSLLRQETTLQRGAKAKRMVCALDTDYLLKVFATAKIDA